MLVCKMHKQKRTRAYRFSGNTPAFPARWFYRLCHALPGDEFVLASVVSGRRSDRFGRAGRTSANLTPATGARTTRFCRTHMRRSSACCDRSREARPAISFHARRCRVHRIPLRVRDDREPPLLLERDAKILNLIWGQREAKYFCRRGWTNGMEGPFGVLPVGRVERKGPPARRAFFEIRSRSRSNR